MSSVMTTHFSLPRGLRIDGALNITSRITSSRIFLSPLAPVPSSIARSATALRDSGVNSSFTPSIARSPVYWFTSESHGSVRIRKSSSFPSGLTLVIIGRRPMNSGMSPNSLRSHGCTRESNSPLHFAPVPSEFPGPENPIRFLPAPSLRATMSSRPTKAPDAMKRMSEVFT